MTTTTRFQMVLVDRLSSGAKSGLDGIRRLDQGVKALANSLRGNLRRAITDAAGKMRGLNGQGTTSLLQGTRGAIGRTLGGASGGGLFSGTGWAAVAAGATEAARAIVGIGVALGRNVIEMAAFRESTLASLETVMGSSEAAGRTFRNAMTVAGQTPLDTAGVVNMANRFAVAGFQERELAPLMGAASDLAAAFSQQAGDSFALVVSQMRSADRMDRGDLRQMLNAGINQGEVLDAIARQLNIQGSTERARRQAVLSAITHGRVRGDVGITAAMEAINRRMDGGGQLGAYARRQSETLTGALSNAKNAWDNLLMGMRTEDSPGLQAMARAVLAITGALGPEGAIGRELRGLVSDFTNILGEGIFGGGVQGNIDGFAGAIRSVRPWINDLLRGVVAFGRGFREGFMTVIGPTLDLLFQLGTAGEDSSQKWQRLGAVVGFAAGLVVNGIGVLVGSVLAFVGMTNAIYNGGSLIVEWFSSVPGQMVDGFIMGLREHWGRLLAELRILGAELPGPIRSALGIRSPSRVMMQLGAFTAEGFRLGIDSGSGGVGDAVEGLTSLRAAPSALQAGAGGVQGGISVVINVEAHPGTDGDRVGREAGAAFVRQLAEVFGALNLAPV